MAGVINTGTHPKLLWPGVNAVWGQIYNAHPTEYTALFDVKNSDKAYEQDVEVTGFPLATIKGQGAPGYFVGEEQGWVTTYAHIAYSLGFIVTYEELRDNLYKEVATRRAQANAFAINQTVETVGAFLYNNAFSTSYFTTPDGKSLVATDHVGAAGGTFSNRLSPDADFSEAAMEDLATQIMLMTSDIGLKINAMPRSLHVHPQNWWQANRVLNSTLQSDTANNNINVLKATNALPEGIKVNHYFSSPNAWFVRTNIPNGMTMFWRDKPRLEQDNDFDTKNAKALCYMRFSVGCTDVRGIYGSNGP